MLLLYIALLAPLPDAVPRASCGDPTKLIATIDHDGAAALTVYSFASDADAERIDAAFVVSVQRRMHTGGLYKGSVIVTRANLLSVFLSLAALDLCPVDLTVLPGVIARDP